MATLFSLKGQVKHSLQRGRTLGYPTANLTVSSDTPEGIYLALTQLDSGEKKPSLLFVGSALTFNEVEKKGEVYILDYNDDIYGKNIKVAAVKKLRDNKKFESKEELIAQIQKDEQDARSYFNNY